MNAQEIVKKAFVEIEKGAIDASSYTEDMIFSGPVPQPIKRNEYVTLMKNLVGAFPDWNFHARDFRVLGDTVTVTVGITGTHTRTLPGLMLGMLALPPTNKRFILPEEHLSIKVRGDKICELVADVVPGGGVIGILAQLGVQLKKAA
jgi:SnoaL-like polyketide cyclase